MTNLVLFVLGEESFELSFEARETGCYINSTFLAIGGGGRGYSYNGGGSGFIEIGRQLLFSNSSVHVYAGDSGARSLVQVDGDTLIEAASGGRTGGGGGDGYCGGGGRSYNNEVGGAGGTNGGDGGNGTQYGGGQGSGLDLSTLHMDNFVLTPGKGGEPNGE